MPKIGRKVKIFSALEVANICGVVNQTAINWIKNGHLKAFTTPGGQYRIYAKDLAAFLDTRGMADSEEALQGLLEKSNWNSILIAVSDTELNNRLREDILAVFPGFFLAQAFDAFDLGLRLATDKPGLILLDEELSGINLDKLFQLLKADIAFNRPYIYLIGNNENSAFGTSVDKLFTKPLNRELLHNAIKEIEKPAEISA